MSGLRTLAGSELCLLSLYLVADHVNGSNGKGLAVFYLLISAYLSFLSVAPFYYTLHPRALSLTLCHYSTRRRYDRPSESSSKCKTITSSTASSYIVLINTEAQLLQDQNP